MSELTWIIAFTALGGGLSALAASAFLLASDRVRARVLPHMVSFATGALLAAALLGLLPHAIEAVGPQGAHGVGLAVLIGILIFFVLEKLVLWRHCHQEVCEGHIPGDHHRDAASASLILIGDGFHNILDGVLIAAAFMTDLHLGVVTAIAVFAHEIPQEVGDLAILLHSGMTRGRALTLNLLTSLTSVLGGVLAYFALQPVASALPYAIALAASSFLYIAVADLIPGLHRRVDPGTGVKQFGFIVLGVLLIYFTHQWAHGA
jgi:zinc and cadmium transporter